ncbi:MAG: hypothetical protein HC906_03815 [Bacteroidales bacterium]|nr:hypothetical protein [Bacteroidales bacterium]
MLLATVFVSCEKKEKQSIAYYSVNKEFVLIRNVEEMRQSGDEISEHVDSILSGFIQTEFISTGQKNFDLNDNDVPDIGFEIIDLMKFNPQGLPESFDSLAARVYSIQAEILDNSTYGYADALNIDDIISEDGNWVTRSCVLGTFMNAGQF